jgi:hypothetical protein
MIVGGVAGLVAQTVTYPFEVTRRRMQTNGLVSANLTKELLGGSRSSSSSTTTTAAAAETTVTINARRTTMRDTIKYLYKEQGERGFFKGVSMVRSLCSVTYDNCYISILTHSLILLPTANNSPSHFIIFLTELDKGASCI